MRELHLSDLWAIGAGLLIFLALLVHDAWLPTVRAFVSGCLIQLRATDWAYIMSRAAQPSPALTTNQTEQRSDAVEPGMEPSGTEDGNAVPDIVEQLEALDDDTLLDILALLRDDQGSIVSRKAESQSSSLAG